MKNSRVRKGSKAKLNDVPSVHDKHASCKQSGLGFAGVVFASRARCSWRSSCDMLDSMLVRVVCRCATCLESGYQETLEEPMAKRASRGLEKRVRQTWSLSRVPHSPSCYEIRCLSRDPENAVTAARRLAANAPSSPGHPPSGQRPRRNLQDLENIPSRSSEQFPANRQPCATQKRLKDGYSDRQSEREKQK